MAFIKTVGHYSAFRYPNKGQENGRINLYCSDQRLYMMFSDPSITLQSNSYNESHKICVAYQQFSQFQYYLDLVRNEKSIYVTFRPENSPPNFVVYRASEPPGEGEM